MSSDWSGAAVSRVMLAVKPLHRVRIRDWSAIVVWASGLAWGVCFATLAAGRHNAFLSHRFDLGNMTQAVWSTAHGRFLEVTTTSGQQLTRLGVHVDPLLALFAPIWWLWPSPEMLTTLQAFALATGAIPVYRLARKHTGDHRAALNLALAYLLYPAVQWSALNDFHPVTLAIPLLLFFVWFLDEDRLLAAGVCAVLAAMSKEDIPLVIAGIGVWYALRRGHPRTGGAIAVLGVGWTLVALTVVIPRFSGGPSPFYDRYASVGGSPRGIVTAFFTDPLRIWDAATTGADIRYLALLLLPLLGLWALEPLLALAATPVLVLNLLSDFWSMNRIEYQYTSGIVACVFGAVAIGAGRLGRRRALAATTVVLGVVAVTSLGGPISSIGTYGAHARPSRAKVEALHRALELIPSGVPVSASNNIGAHLSERRHIFSFPVRERAEWVIVDVSDAWLAGDGEKNDVATFRADIATLRRDSRWKAVYSSVGVLVFRRVGAASAERTGS